MDPEKSASALSDLWKEWGPSMKVVAVVLVAIGVLAYAYGSIRGTSRATNTMNNNIHVSPLPSPPPGEPSGKMVNNGPIFGLQFGNNNKQEITVNSAEEKSVYTSASVLSQERDGDQWVTKILFNRSPGKWDAAETSRFSLVLDGPYDETRVDDAEGFLSPRGGMIQAGIGRRRPAEGIWEQEIITPPRNGQEVVIRFRGPRPLGIIRAAFSPQ